MTARVTDSRPWRRLYGTARWARLRATKLAHAPLCERCLASEIITEATVVHHRKAHKGDLDLFWSSDNLESLCKAHHDRDGQLEDKGKSVVRYDANGWPL